MTTQTANRKKQNGTSPPPGLPDLAWYRDADSRRKRNAHIKELCEQIAREFNPQKIILFGSQAYGKPTVESDIDLLVVMPDGTNRRQTAIAIRSTLGGLGVAKDVVVTTPDEITRRGDLIGTVLRPALREGKVLYDRSRRGSAAVATIRR